jgi:putative ABC transport system substrate-binding protein
MKRREFIAAVGGAAVWPLAGRAQSASRDPRKIAFLPNLNPATLEDWRADMRVLGWTEGRDFTILQSGIEGGSRNSFDEAAQGLVAKKPDLIVTGSTALAVAAQRATKSIPIVMLTSGYPVEAGVADSLAKPGRNVTGNTIYAEMAYFGKLLQLLREAKPDIKRIGVLWTYVPPAFPKEEIEPGYTELNNAARALDLDIHVVEVANSDQMQAALAQIDKFNPEGLLLTIFLTGKAMSLVTQYAVEKRLPTITDFDVTRRVSPHPLMCYGAIFRELTQSAAASIDKILRGSSPADLPIQRPRRFELIVSLITAKAIGLDLPPTLIAQADRLLE